MDLSSIESIPWSKLKNAYGSAKNSPDGLRALVSGDEDEIDEAIYGFLHSDVCHQHTTYSCTPYVVRCVISILECVEFKSSHLYEILGFINACTYGAKTDASLNQEILAGESCYRKITLSGGEQSLEIANKLLEYCAENS